MKSSRKVAERILLVVTVVVIAGLLARSLIFGTDLPSNWGLLIGTSWGILLGSRHLGRRD